MDNDVGHVVFVVNNYPPHRGGVEQHVQALATRLAGRGVETSVLTLAPRASRSVEQGVHVHRLAAHLSVGGIVAVPTPGAWRRASHEVLGRATHVSVQTRFFPMTALGLRAGHRLGLPVVHTEHGSAHVHTSSAVVNRAARVIDLTVGRMVLQRADRVLAVSDRVSDFVQELSGRRSEPFGNGVDLERWLTDRDPEPRSVLTYLGRVVDEKGWFTFVEVVDRARQQFPHVRGQVIGGGPGLGALKAELSRRGLEGVVVVHGEVDHDDVPRLLAGTVYLNPTLASEGFQLTLPEAVVCGGRVVTYDVPSVALLRAAGAPVRVVARGDVDGLVASVLDELVRPSPAAAVEALAPWDWDRLTDRFVAVLAEATPVHHPGP